MQLELSYAEMSLLRGLVNKKQLDIWHQRYAPRLRRGMSIEEITETKDKIMNMPLEELRDCGPINDITCCALLIHKFEELEQETKKILAKEVNYDSANLS